METLDVQERLAFRTGKMHSIWQPKQVGALPIAVSVEIIIDSSLNY